MANEQKQQLWKDPKAVGLVQEIIGCAEGLATKEGREVRLEDIVKCTEHLKEIPTALKPKP
jgi:hypothetical protein